MSSTKNSTDDILRELVEFAQRTEEAIKHITTMITIPTPASQLDQMRSSASSTTIIPGENDPSSPRSPISENEHFDTTNPITPQYNPQINALLNVLNPLGHYQQPSSLPTGTLPTCPYWKDLFPAAVNAAKANQLQQKDYERIAAIARKYILFLAGLLEDARKKSSGERRSFKNEIADLKKKLDDVDMDGSVGNDLEQREQDIREKVEEVKAQAEELENRARSLREWDEELRIKDEYFKGMEVALNAHLDEQDGNHTSSEYHSKVAQQPNQDEKSPSQREEGTMQSEGRNEESDAWMDEEMMTGLRQSVDQTSPHFSTRDQHQEVSLTRTVAESSDSMGEGLWGSSQDGKNEGTDCAPGSDWRNSWNTPSRGGPSDWNHRHSVHSTPNAGYSPDQCPPSERGRTIGYKEQQTSAADFVTNYGNKVAKERAKMKSIAQKHGYGNTRFEDKVTGKTSRAGTPLLKVDDTSSTFKTDEEKLAGGWGNTDDRARGEEGAATAVAGKEAWGKLEDSEGTW